MEQEERKPLLVDISARLPYRIKGIITYDGRELKKNNNITNIIDMKENLPHKVSETICVKCGYRWISVRPVTTLLKDLECPWCGKQGYTIETGEVIEQDYER